MPDNVKRVTYYYLKNNDSHGPVSLNELRGLWQSGEIASDTQVCTEGAESWVPLHSLGGIEESQPVERAAPPVPPSVATHEYAVVPFVAVIAHGKGSDAAATQLQQLIRSYSSKGWEYVRLESVETYIAGDAGCFGLGAVAPRTTVYTMAVFRR